jgi:RNA polymerase sigma factor (sigma-70 family)
MTGDGATCQRTRWVQAFLDLITMVEGELRGHIYSQVGSWYVTEEIVHRIFIKAWDSAEFDPEHTDARAWLFQRADWRVVDWFRSAESNSISIEVLITGIGTNGSRGSRSAALVDRGARDPLIEAIKAEEKRNLHAALARLPEDQREVLERYYLRQEGTQIEIADKMGIPLATFNNRMNDARHALKRELQHGAWRGGRG